MSKLEINKLDHIGKKLVGKIAQRMEKYQGDLDFDVSKIRNLNIDVKNQVLSEVIEPVEAGIKRVTHNNYKKFNELIEFWCKTKDDYNNKDNKKSNSECKQIFKELIKMDYFHHVD